MGQVRLRAAAENWAITPAEDRRRAPLMRIIPDGQPVTAQLLDDIEAITGVRVSTQGSGQIPARCRATLHRWAVKERRQWESVRAATLRVGDLTPYGKVEKVTYYAGIRRLTLTVAGQSFDRKFSDLVDRRRVTS